MKSPFKFLNPYDQKDKDIFFGRDDEINELYQMVFQTNLLLVYGLSGTGKTSLVQCGLAGKFDGPEWHPFFIRRQNNILDSIAQTFTPYLDGGHESLLSSVEAIYNKYYRPVYLIFDQFEEIFVMGSKQEREAFIAELKELLEAHIPCKVIIVMREEYIGQLYAFEKEIPTLRDFRFRVEQMGIQRVKQVIASTFGAFNVHIEEPKEELLDQMVQNISDEKSGIALPYLQVYMDVLYRGATKGVQAEETAEGTYPEVTITRKDVEAAGEIEDILGNFLDQQMKLINKQVKSLHPEYKEGGLAAFIDGFVTPDGTKKPIPYHRENGRIVFSASEMENLPSMSDDVMDMLIDGLENSRLLRVTDDSIELAHDSLAALIDERRSDEQRSLNNIKKRLLNEFHEYQVSHEPLSRKQLITFEEYIPILNLDREVLDFIHFSEKEATRKEQEKLEQKRKELEVKQEKRQAELLAQKAQAEREKVEAEKKTIEAGKKARRLRIAVLVSVIGILGLLAWALYANSQAQKNARLLAEQKEQLAVDEKKEIEKKSKEIEKLNKEIEKKNKEQSVMIQGIREEMEDLDPMINGEAPVKIKKLVKSGLYIQEYLNGVSKKEIEKKAAHAFVPEENFFLTKKQGVNRWDKKRPLPKPDSLFRRNETVFIYMGFRSINDDETVKLSIITPDGETIKYNKLSGQYKEVEIDHYDVSARGYRVQRYYTPRKKGTYTVRLQNKGGALWERTFTVQ